jgi:hypothetical protein
VQREAEVTVGQSTGNLRSQCPFGAIFTIFWNNSANVNTLKNGYTHS